jgi:hypothetical protein
MLDTKMSPRRSQDRRVLPTNRVWRGCLIILASLALVCIGLLGIVRLGPHLPTDPAPPLNAHDETPGVWLSERELEILPTSGPAWEHLLDVADESMREETDLARRDDHNIQTLAAALVGERLNDDQYREKALAGLRTVVDEPPRDDLLAAARRLGTYVIAADLLDLPTLDPEFEEEFRRWADMMRRHPYKERRFGNTIIDAAEGRPNNWGTHAGASRVAVAAYLDDEVDLRRQSTVFRGYLGDTEAYAGFLFGDLEWQDSQSRPVGINPVGAARDGHSLDGVLPDDQRRGGSFRWPPDRENYVWEALQGATVQAEILARRGYDAWGWEDAALLRAVRWLHDEADFPAEGDDRWVPWLVNHAYDTDFPTEETRPGKNMGFTDWTHTTSPSRSADPVGTTG